MMLLLDSLPPLAPAPDLGELGALLKAAPREPGAIVFERGPMALIRQGRKAGFEVRDGETEEFYRGVSAYSESCLARARAICRQLGIPARIRISVDDAMGFSTDRWVDGAGRARISISLVEMLSWGLDEAGFDFCILHEAGHHEGENGWAGQLWIAAALSCLLGTIALVAMKLYGWQDFNRPMGYSALGLLFGSYVSTMAGLRAQEHEADAFAARVLGKERALAGARQALEGSERKETRATRWLGRIAMPFGGTHPSTRARLSSLSKQARG